MSGDWYYGYTLAATSQSSSATSFYYSSDDGFYYGYSNYLTNSNGSWTVSSSSGKSNLYSTTTQTTEAVNGTEITFTGKAAGTTAVTIGGTTYTVNVISRSGNYETSVAVGGTASVKLPDGAVGDGETVTWTVSDSKYAGVYSTDGTNATITGRTVTETGKPVNVVATVKDSEGNTVAIYTWATTVTSGTKNNAGKYTVTYESNNTVYNGHLYYALSGGELIEPLYDETTDDDGNTIRTYKTISLTDSGVDFSQLDLFVVPDEGYAVTTVTDTAGTSRSQFYKIDENNLDATYSSSHTGALYWKKSSSDTTLDEERKAMTAEALNKGCDVVFWYTRQANDSSTSKHVIRCDKLPTIEKTIETVGGKAYTEGMK